MSNSGISQGTTYFTAEDKIYTDFVKSTNILDGQTLKETIKKYYNSKGNEQARYLDIIVGSLQKLIIKIAKESQTRFISSFDIMDLVQEGNLGLIKALNVHLQDKRKGYDPSKNIMPSTYFTAVLTNYINNYICRNRNMIHITQSDSCRIDRVKQVYAAAENKSLSLAKALEEYNEEQKKLPIQSQLYLTESDLYEYNALTYKSIYDPIAGQNDSSDKEMYLSDVIADNSQNIEKTIEHVELFEIVAKGLTKSEYEFILDYIDGMSTKELSKKYKKSIMEVKTLQNRLIEKLRNNEDLKNRLGVA